MEEQAHGVHAAAGDDASGLLDTLGRFQRLGPFGSLCRFPGAWGFRAEGFELSA